MRRAMTTLFAAAVTAVLLVGCAGAGGLDGDLTDDWAALPPAVPFTPAAGVCQAADFTDVVTLAGYQPVDCAGPHRVETVHVGAFPVERATAPAGGSAELRGAFAECDTRATGYVGDDWRAGRLRLSVALPSGPGWAAGSRWYRCDLSELTTVEAAATVVVRSGSLRDALKGSPRCGWAASRPAARPSGARRRWSRWSAVSATTPSSSGCGGHRTRRTRPGTRTGLRSTPAAARSSAGTWACRTTPSCDSAAVWWSARRVRGAGGSATEGSAATCGSATVR